KAIIETGTSWDAERILEAVHAFGLRPQEIDAVVVSHIHLDHAGGAGFLIDSMRSAKVYVHERGHKHLVDPASLVASAQQALAPAPAFDLEQNLETFRRLLALRPRGLLFSHYGPHSKPAAAIEAMMAAYPAWAQIVRNKLASMGEDGVLRELYDMSCRAAKR